jgi:hypothetical protein
MGESKNVDELNAKLVAAGATVVGLGRQTVTAAALVYKGSVLAQARVASGGDMRLSRWGRQAGGLKLGAGFNVQGNTSAVAVLTPRPMGPWKVVEAGHGPARFKRRKGGRGRKVPRTPPIAQYRTKGKRSWSKGVVSGRPGAVLAARRVQVDGLSKVFGR